MKGVPVFHPDLCRPPLGEVVVVSTPGWPDRLAVLTKHWWHSYPDGCPFAPCNAPEAWGAVTPPTTVNLDANKWR